ncbi:Formimidoyltransferase-cyclodeaminase [Trichoplax sp. H2]|nr:Formimidoyltransferase-cyclodeaminase [Trichoplax sp. H2]|eukprot:RDD40181.1 Formimidoyltransferase-cyclodeaminase [Trichoplax sp. H2]
MSAETAIIECVPNFSEGTDKSVIDAIAKAISSTDGCSLLDIDCSTSTNRTVYTFVGSPSNVVQGAFNAALQAFSLIDMKHHKETYLCCISDMIRSAVCISVDEFSSRSGWADGGKTRCNGEKTLQDTLSTS